MKKQIAVYCTAEFLFTMSHAMVMTTYIFFMTKIGLNLFEIGKANIGYIVASLVFTVPTGIIADRIGRKKSYLIACAIHGLAITGYFFVNSFWDAVIVESIGGLGMAFYDGSLTALIIDKIRKKGGNVNKVLSTSRFLSIIAMIVGGSLGAIMGTYNLGYPFLAGGVFSVICALFAFFFVKEEKRVLGKKLKIRNYLLVCESLGHIKDVLRHPILFPLAMMSFATGLAGELFTKMWTLHLEPLLPSTALFSPILTILMIGSAIGAIIGYRAKERNFPILIVVFRFLIGILLTVCALVPGIYGKVFSLSVFEIALAAPRSIADAEANAHIESKNRAAVISAYGMICGLGGILGLLCGFFADKFSIEFIWIRGGIISSLISLCFGLTYLHNKRKTSL